jgi:hypothetical protein
MSDLGMCQSVNNEEQSANKKEYCLIWHQKFYVDSNIQSSRYTVYSFGIVMNEETLYSDIPHDYSLEELDQKFPKIHQNYLQI